MTPNPHPASGNGDVIERRTLEQQAEMIAKFRTPPGFSWTDLRDDILTLCRGREAKLSEGSGDGKMRELLERAIIKRWAKTYEELVGELANSAEYELTDWIGYFCRETLQVINEALATPAPSPTRETCAHCGGSGDDQNQYNDPGPCHHCDGEGEIASPIDAAGMREACAKLCDAEKEKYLEYSREAFKCGDVERGYQLERKAEYLAGLAGQIRALPTPALDREKIARLIDPMAFERTNEFWVVNARKNALKRADDVIALIGGRHV